MAITMKRVIYIAKILVPLVMADTAYVVARSDYRRYLIVKYRLECSEAKVQLLNAIGGNVNRKHELAYWERKQHLYAAHLKEYKWTAKFDEMLPRSKFEIEDLYT